MAVTPFNIKSYMEEKYSKRSYYIPDQLLEYFAKWSKPGRGYSTSVSGALLVWMSLDPAIRDKALSLTAHPNVKQSIKELDLLLRRDIVDTAIEEYRDSLTDEQKLQLLAAAKAAKKRIAQKK